jgi:hypothetical protein
MGSSIRLVVAAIVMAGTLFVPHANAAAIGVGQSLTMEALVMPSLEAEQAGVLKLKIERSPEAPFAALSLDISVPQASPGLAPIHVSTLSLFGLRPGASVSLLVPLPRQAMAHIQNGKLPLELRLESPSAPDVTAAAAVQVNEAVIGDATLQ